MVEPRSAFVVSETLTLDSDQGSTAIDCRYYRSGSYQLTWSGVGGLSSTIMPQMSNDGSNWVDLENYWGDVLYT